MRLSGILSIVALCSTAYCKDLGQPLTQSGVCRSSHNSIVQISASVGNSTSLGTGFIVSPEGWIITALHVVADKNTRVGYDSINVSVNGYTHAFTAKIVSPLNKITAARDFAILKIDATALQALKLGSELNIEDGSPIVVLGYPFSASEIPRGTIIPPFCLSGTIAAQTSFRGEGIEFIHTVYFQGVSIKGISGAPIISLQTGKVVGVVSTKLTGIGIALDKVRKNTSAGGDVEIVGTNGNIFGVGAPLTEIINVLDNQLANGLGAGSGASDIANALDQAKREYSDHNSRH